jgi:ribonuclease BN (tRNA processing enzyme)
VTPSINHTSPVEAAGIADEANVKLLVLTHVVPALPNALMRQMFMRDVKAVRGSGDTILGEDGLLIPFLPARRRSMPTSSSFRAANALRRDAR